MAKKLRAVVVGYGDGGSTFVEEFAQNDRFQLVGVADLRKEVRERTEKQFKGTKAYESYADMFAELKPDIVSVHTYPPSHHIVVREALKHSPKGFITEKPLGDTVEHGAEIVESLKKKGIPAQVPHSFAINAVGNEVRKRVYAGDIGDLRVIEIQNKDWDFMNAGIHWLHSFVLLTRNEPIDFVMAATESSTKTYRDGMQVETTGVSYTQTRSGIRCIMQTGDDTLVLSESGGLSYKIIGYNGIIEWGKGGYYIQSPKHPSRTFIEAKSGYTKAHYVNILADEIESGKADYSNMDASLTALQIVEASYLAGKFQQKITFPWDPKKIAALKRDEVYWPGVPYPGHGGGRNGKVN